MRPSPPPAFLVVDDDIDHAVIMRTVISMLAPEVAVTVCTDTGNADAALRSTPYAAVVLIDRLLGPRESYPLIESWCRRRPDLHVALLSATLTDADHARALGAGAAIAAEKPATLDGWRTLLTGLLVQQAGVHAGDAAA